MKTVQFLGSQGEPIEISLTDEQHAHFVLHQQTFQAFHVQYQAQIRKIDRAYHNQVAALQANVAELEAKLKGAAGKP